MEVNKYMQSNRSLKVSDNLCPSSGSLSYSDVGVKHESMWAFNSIADSLCADVFVYKSESCRKDYVL
jgi:hypothetical protein